MQQDNVTFSLLCDLPVDLLLLIARKLSLFDVSRLSQTCSHLNQLLQYDGLYQNFASYFSTFGFSSLFPCSSHHQHLVASGRTDLITKLSLIRESVSPYFGFFFGTDSLHFCNLLTRFAVTAHKFREDKVSFADVQDGKKRGMSAESQVFQHMNLLLSMAKEPRRYGVCVMVEHESGTKMRQFLVERFPDFQFRFEKLTDLLADYFEPGTMILVYFGSFHVRFSGQETVSFAPKFPPKQRSGMDLKRNAMVRKNEHAEDASYLEPMLEFVASKLVGGETIVLAGNPEKRFFLIVCFFLCRLLKS